MATETLRPSAPGDSAQWIAYPAVPNWQNVDEGPGADDVATYNAFTSEFYTSAELQICILENTVTTKSANKTISPDYTWLYVSQQWNARPSDSGAWTWGDIDALQIGMYESVTGTATDLYNLPAHSIGSGTINFIKVYLKAYRALASKGREVIYVTQAYVEVDYEAAAEEEGGAQYTRVSNMGILVLRG